ncbi:hypothetical protein [Corynebacterium nuruki]|uniref:Uncharacterized protein n=1 Tax=Corynebacterium nuruki TaxID=1032851 RepID=A0A3D4T131_9CORY|nr:hypothetical protein [Corynebacterium nuruki]HCT15242.1 hypothetical protein [Corynebacterium nuruki]
MSDPRPGAGYHGALVPDPKTGAEPVLDDDGRPCGNLLGFWRWAYAQTLDNALRGVLAEYLVGLAVDGLTRSARVEWDAYDLDTPDGHTVEVKSTAYLQSWAQKSPSVLTFNIPETSGWDPATGGWAPAVRRQAQVYVFCVFTATDPETADPLDTRQWDFYVAPTAVIDRVLGTQKTVTLGSLLQRVGPERTTFSGLADAVRRATAGDTRDNREPRDTA